jgi:TPR repeat protein
MKSNKLLFSLIMLISVFLHSGSYSCADQLEEGKAAFVRHEYQKAYTLLLPLAEVGDTFAQTNIGYMLSQGLGVVKNEKEAIRWYEKAALKGDSDAQYNIGSMYETGRGTKQDYIKALEWYSKSAEQGNAFAQEKLGSLYYNGNGVELNYQKAIYWYSKSAEQGYSLAQNSLGVMYINGFGVKKDLDKGYKWILKAAEQGLEVAQENAYDICYDAARNENIGAMHNLAYMCLNGWSGKQDPYKCITLLEMAAEKVFAPSVSALVKIYKQGSYGITADQRKALYWGEKAKKMVDK